MKYTKDNIQGLIFRVNNNNDPNTYIIDHKDILDYRNANNIFIGKYLKVSNNYWTIDRMLNELNSNKWIVIDSYYDLNYEIY